MLIASPLAGLWADRHGSRALSAAGHGRQRRGRSRGMTTLGIDSGYWLSTLWLFVVGVGSGMFNSPNTAAMMGTVAPNRRGIAAGTRTMLQNTGAVHLNRVRARDHHRGGAEGRAVQDLLGRRPPGLSDQTLAPFVHNMHTALWVLAATSMVGAGVSLLRPRHIAVSRERPGQDSNLRPAA